MNRHPRGQVRALRPTAHDGTPTIGLPRGTRGLAVRVTGHRAPGSVLPFDGAGAAGPVSLAVGGRGQDPDVVFPAGSAVCVIDTHLDLAPRAGGFTVTGRHLGARSGPATLELRWGVSTPRGHFLLLSGLLLRLPHLVLCSGSSEPDLSRTVLAATLALSDADGVLRRGVVPTADLAWALTTDDALTASTA